MSLKRWELINSKEEYKTKFFSVEKRTYKLPNGNILDDYYHINRPNFVLVIAVNSENKILIERTYRRAMDNLTIELPAGYIDNVETLIEASLRELKEETGYTGATTLLGEVYIQPGFINQVAYVVKIIIDEKNIVDIKREADEDIEIEFLSMDEINKLIAENKVKDMSMLSAMNIYEKMKN